MNPSDISSVRSILKNFHYTADALDNPPNHPMRGYHICGSARGFAPGYCFYCWRSLRDAVLRKIKSPLHRKRFIKACRSVAGACPEAGREDNDG